MTEKTFNITNNDDVWNDMQEIIRKFYKVICVTHRACYINVYRKAYQKGKEDAKREIEEKMQMTLCKAGQTKLKYWEQGKNYEQKRILKIIDECIFNESNNIMNIKLLKSKIKGDKI